MNNTPRAIKNKTELTIDKSFSLFSLYLLYINSMLGV